MTRRRYPTIIDWMRGVQLLLVLQYIDVNYLLWRFMWDTTEEEDFINGTCEATIITERQSMTPNHREFPVTTICGSMRFWPEIQELAHDLTEQGWIVLMPLVHVIGPAEQASSNTKKMLDEMHLAKIDLSQAIHIVHRGAAMPNQSYVGDSTRKEIEYARRQGKDLYYVAQP